MTYEFSFFSFIYLFHKENRVNLMIMCVQIPNHWLVPHVNVNSSVSLFREMTLCTVTGYYSI